jgi:uncharacterized protein YjiS (DUF1127 family)
MPLYKVRTPKKEGHLRNANPIVGYQLRSHGSAGIAGLVAAALRLVRLWRHRARDRALLAAFDDRMLRDIGVTRADVTREIDKPFWREW